MTNKAVSKTESHTTFYIRPQNNKVKKASIVGLNSERFIEKILVGRKYYEAPVITSRICGSCSVVHSTTSAKAMENALGIKASNQTETLRKLLLCGQMIQSHSFHLYYSVAPDYLGLSSFFELQKNHPDIFIKAIKLKKYADTIVETIGGRAVHPISNVIGGFTKLPDKEKLNRILELYSEIFEIAEETVRFFASLNLPDIDRDIIYSSLFNTKEYAYYDGDIKTTAGNLYQDKNYTKYVYEELEPNNRAKFATLQGKTVMVGAMARCSINRNKLNKDVLKLIADLNIDEDLTNPFYNIVAQAIENYHFVTESKNIVDSLLKNDIKNETIKEPKSFNAGTFASEAPNGTLFHHYEVNKEGYITKCDIITPTNFLLPTIDEELKDLKPILKGKKKAEQKELREVLISALNPCSTCAPH